MVDISLLLREFAGPRNARGRTSRYSYCDKDSGTPKWAEFAVRSLPGTGFRAEAEEVADPGVAAEGARAYGGVADIIAARAAGPDRQVVGRRAAAAVLRGDIRDRGIV